jgi:hypothetical protein
LEAKDTDGAAVILRSIQYDVVAAQYRLAADGSNCVCGYDEKTGLRMDILCPVHDAAKA